MCVYVFTCLKGSLSSFAATCFWGGFTLFLIIFDLQSLPSNQMAIASQMAADPANLFPQAP